jgi:hypothetical protein
MPSKHLLTWLTTASLLAPTTVVAAPQGDLDCGQFSTVTTTTSESDSTDANYDSCADEKRAAEHGLKNKVVAQTGITCDECPPPNCHSGVYYWDPGQLSSRCYYDPATGKFSGSATWAGGDCQIYCTTCP